MKKAIKKKQKKKYRKKRQSSVDGEVKWDVIKQAYLSRNIERKEKEDPVTLGMLAIEFNVIYGTLRNKASEGKWHDELRTHISEVNEKVLDTVIEITVEEEVKVRTRQARIGRSISSVGLKVITEKSEDELKLMSMRDALTYVKTGVDIEFRALGLPDRYEFKDTTRKDSSHATVEEAIENHKKKLELADQLLVFAEKMSIPPKQIVENIT